MRLEELEEGRGCVFFNSALVKAVEMFVEITKGRDWNKK